MGDFSSLNTALSALFAQRHALDVTGQNVANANTEGYSRQRVRMQSAGAPNRRVDPLQDPQRGRGREGGVVRPHQGRLPRVRALQEHSTDANLRQTQSVMSRIELSFSEPSDNGLQAQMSEFWSSWHALGKQP